MLKAKITANMKAAMRSGDKERLQTIRLILAAIQQREVDERIELTDEQVLATLDKQVKQRRESIDQFQKAGREDLIAKEKSELVVILSYLPEPLGDTEIDKLIADAISSTQASSIKDMGKVMGILKPQLQGRADMGQVGTKIKNQLGG